MKIDSSLDLLAQLAQTQLMEAHDLEDIRQAVLPRHDSACALAAELVESRRLTSYQAEQLLDGQGHSLVLEGYRILEPLGQGGMGQVFKAEQARLSRLVALKVISQECLSKSADAIRRFQREARAAAQLSHPNVIAIYDAGQRGDTHFIVMEYVEGIDLDRLVHQCGQLPVASACDYIRQAALGLQHAHERGLIHRDIKPSNVLITHSLAATPGPDAGSPSETAQPASSQTLAQRLLTGGVAKLLDLGLARLAESLDRPTETALTEAGKLVGTPDYIAPEQARDSRHADGRADIYSLGCTLYFVLAGRHPFPEGNLIEKLLMHQMDEPEPVESLRPDVPPAVAAVVRKMMAKQPQARYQAPREVAEALHAALEAPGAPPSPPAVIPEAPTGRRILPATQLTPVLPLELPPVPPAPSPAKVPTPAPADPSAEETPTNSWTGYNKPEDEQTTRSAAQELAVIGGHKGCVLAIAFAPDRNTLASASVDGTVRLWDFCQGKPRELATLSVSPAEVTALAFTPNQKMLTAGTGSGTLLCWDLTATGPRPKEAWEAHRQAVAALDPSADGRSFLSGGADRTVYLWNLEGGRPQNRATLQGHQGEITAVAFAPDSKTVATAASDGTVRLWEPRRFWNREQAALRVCRAVVSCIAFAADGRRLACGTLEQGFSLWELHEGGWRVQDRFGARRSGVRRVLFRPETQTLVTVEDTGRACVWEPYSGALLEEWTFPITSVYSYATTYDGRYLATGRSDGKIVVYRIGAKRASR